MIEIKCIINIMHSNHPQTMPLAQFCGESVFHEIGPWCQKGWGPLPGVQWNQRRLCYTVVMLPLLITGLSQQGAAGPIRAEKTVRDQAPSTPKREGCGPSPLHVTRAAHTASLAAQEVGNMIFCVQEAEAIWNIGEHCSRLPTFFHVFPPFPQYN